MLSGNKKKGYFLDFSCAHSYAPGMMGKVKMVNCCPVQSVRQERMGKVTKTSKPKTTILHKNHE